MTEAIKIALMWVLLIFTFPLVGALAAALTGWVVALIFDDTIHQVVRVLSGSTRFDSVELWEFGAAAGFFSAWLKPTTYTDKAKV